MRRPESTSLLAVGLVTAALGSSIADAAEPNSRHFRFDYGATVSSLAPGKRIRVWIPVPPTNNDQTVRLISSRAPGKPSHEIEPKYGNKILYFEAKAPESGQITFETAYDIVRREVRGLTAADGSPTRLTASERELFLRPNTRVPVGGRATELLKDTKLPKTPVDLGRALYDRVDDHVRYDKSNPGYGNGDVMWVCDSRFGNCTDFHSLFISFSRSQGMPARFEIGFPLPPERGQGKIGGYHCWAFFHTGLFGWVPVDISEADKHPEMKEYYFGNLTEDRITFSSGRDLNLVPKQDGEPLNYFVYPYAEIDGEPVPKEQIRLEFSYADR